jgi:hypothetical protein
VRKSGTDLMTPSSSVSSLNSAGGLQHHQRHHSYDSSISTPYAVVPNLPPSSASGFADHFEVAVDYGLPLSGVSGSLPSTVITGSVIRSIKVVDSARASDASQTDASAAISENPRPTTVASVDLKPLPQSHHFPENRKHFRSQLSTQFHRDSAVHDMDINEIENEASEPLGGNRRRTTSSSSSNKRKSETDVHALSSAGDLLTSSKSKETIGSDDEIVGYESDITCSSDSSLTQVKDKSANHSQSFDADTEIIQDYEQMFN